MNKTPLLSIERVVTLLSPVFVAGAGWLCTAAGKYGIHLSKTGLAAAFTTGAVGAIAGVVTWLHGRQKSEAIQADLKKAENIASPVLKEIDPDLMKQLEAIVEGAATKIFNDPDAREIVQPAPADVPPTPAPAVPVQSA